MKLVIFDLDQTLVDLMPVHDKTTCVLFRQFFGLDTRLSEIDFAGRSLSDNLTKLARLKGIKEEKIGEKSGELLAAYEKLFAENMPEEAGKYVLPGVKRLLDELSTTDNIIVLYTGDSPGIVNTVFKATGLGRYFKSAFYGTETKNRADMVRRAIENAERLTGRRFQDKDIVIIGDSVRDIECGKEFNMYRLSVRTRSKVDFPEITGEVQKAVQSNGVENGVCYIFVPHTTAGVTLNEHADPTVVDDIAARLETVAPESTRYRHAEGNSPAHVKAGLMGSSAVVFVEKGQLVLGTWQGIFLCEFDGPRSRTVLIKVISDKF